MKQFGEFSAIIFMHIIKITSKMHSKLRNNMCLLWFKYPLQNLHWNLIVIMMVFRSETFKTSLSHECSAFKNGLMLIFMGVGYWGNGWVPDKRKKDKVCPISSFCLMHSFVFLLFMMGWHIKKALIRWRSRCWCHPLPFPRLQNC